MSHQQLHQQQPDHHVPPGSMLLSASMSQMPAGVAGGIRTEQHGNQIVHVRDDSDSDLEALFSVLRNIDGRHMSSSFKNRKLPPSFFKQPDKGVTGSQGGIVAPGGQAVHGRSVSSPAQLHHGGSSGNSTASHGKSAGSASVAGMDSYLNEMTASNGVQSSWEISKNCPRYYMTPGVGMWQPEITSQHGSMPGHPNAVYQGRGGAGGGGQTLGSNMQPHQQTVTTSSSSDFTHQEPLPPGWEQGITPDGEIYFINHVDKTTSWYDPRIPRHRQAATPLQAGPHQMISHPHTHPQQQQQQQQQTQQHSHLSPKQQQHQQAQCQMVAHPQMLSNGQHAQIGSSRAAHSEHFICLELQKLHKEKERLQQEQEAINCREMMLNELVRQTAATSPCGGGGGGGVGVSDGQMKCSGGVVPQQPEGALAMLQTMQTLYGSTLESFVSPCSGSGVVESHARQNSTDSGLGGMGTTYSLPRSPDDYLSNVDEMDIQEDVSHGVQKPVNSCYLQMANGGASGDLLHTHMHLTSVGDIIDGVNVMDGDQLLSSLAGDVTSDLLSEMDVQKIDNILYL
jgi:protein yorkie